MCNCLGCSEGSIAKSRFNLENITIVGDGGVIKSKDIQTVKSMGYDYITSIGKDSIRAMCST